MEQGLVTSGMQISRRGLVKGGIGIFGLMAVGGGLLTACAPGEEPDAVAATKGGTATIVIPVALVSLDPPLTGSTPVSSSLRHMLQPFVFLGPKGEAIPALAESWEVAADGMTWTMHLREKVKFHDGSAWTAEVAKMNIDRYLGRPADFPRAQSYGFIDKVNVLDDHTLQLHTETPNSGFINWMSYLALGFHSGESIEKYGDDVGLHGVGTGPFKMTEFVPNERLEMARFDDYWGPKASLDKLIVQTVPDPAGRVSMLETGEAQVVIQVPPTMASTVKDSGTASLIQIPSVRMAFIGINSQYADLKDRKVRQAFNYAVDAKSILKTIVGGNGALATSVVPEMTPGFVAQDPYPYNPKKAAALLDEAGWVLNSAGQRAKDGQVMQLTIRTPDGHTPSDRTTCEAVQGYLKEIGVQCDLQVIDYNVNFAELREEKSITTTSLNYFAYGSSIMDPTHALGIFDGSWTNLNSVFARYRSAEFDEQYKLIVSTVDDEKKLAAACKRAQETAWRDAPWIFLYSLDYLAGVDKSLQGVDVQPNEFYNMAAAAFTK